NLLYQCFYSLFLPRDGNQIDRQCPESPGTQDPAPEGKIQGAEKERKLRRGGTSGTGARPKGGLCPGDPDVLPGHPGGTRVAAVPRAQVIPKGPDHDPDL